MHGHGTRRGFSGQRLGSRKVVHVVHRLAYRLGDWTLTNAWYIGYDITGLRLLRFKIIVFSAVRLDNYSARHCLFHALLFHPSVYEQGVPVHSLT